MAAHVSDSEQHKPSCQAAHATSNYFAVDVKAKRLLIYFLPANKIVFLALDHRMSVSTFDQLVCLLLLLYFSRQTALAKGMEDG